MKWRRAIQAALAALLLAPAGAAAQVPPPPRDFNVNVTTDAGQGGCDASECTLREAISAARPVDTVRVPQGHYVIGAELNPLGDRIVGSGAGLTVIDGGNLRTRVFRVSGTTAASITGVTVTGGVGIPTAQSGLGGGILVESGATLDLADSVVAGNFAENGGGIANAGTLRLSRSTVSGNRAEGLQAAGRAGGIYAQGSTELRNTTVSGNSASAAAGGVLAVSRLVLENVTVAYNTAPLVGGIAQAVGAAAPDTTIDNTLVARNTGGACGGDAGGVSVWKGDHNLDDDGSCEFTATGDRSGVDPQIGLLADNGGPTQTHALAAGSAAVDAGADCAATDQRGAARSGACDIGAFEYVPPPAPPSQSQEGLPPPVLHEKVNAIPARGTIRVKRPGARRFRKLADDGAQLPVGTRVDALKGRVTIVAASDGQGGTDTALFYGGIFKIGQTEGAKPTTVLTLTETLRRPTAGKASIAAKRKKKRRLWGDGEGKFRTKGKHSAATVVGTKWLVEDRFNSTLTRVVRGRVSVRDFAKNKTVIVRAGKRYVARAG